LKELDPFMRHAVLRINGFDGLTQAPKDLFPGFPVISINDGL
jgi:hypothetical protein